MAAASGVSYLLGTAIGLFWIPAFAGMTRGAGVVLLSLVLGLLRPERVAE